MGRFRRLYVASVVGVVSALGWAGSALAAPGDPPTFDVADLVPGINDFAVLMLAGVVTLIAAVLVIKAPFALVNIALRAIRRLFGPARPSAT